MWGGGSVTPLITIENEAGFRYHIIEDDHCYVLIGSVAPESDYCAETSWWFAEAVEALRMLPPLGAMTHTVDIKAMKGS